MLLLIYIVGDGLGFRLRFEFQTHWLHCTVQNMFTLHRLGLWLLILYRTGIRVRVRTWQCKWAITYRLQLQRRAHPAAPPPPGRPRLSSASRRTLPAGGSSSRRMGCWRAPPPSPPTRSAPNSSSASLYLSNQTVQTWRHDATSRVG